MGNYYVTLYWTSQGSVDTLIVSEIRRIAQANSLIVQEISYIANRRSLDLRWSSLAAEFCTNKYIRSRLEAIAFECQDGLKRNYNIDILYQSEVLPIISLSAYL